MSTRVEVTLTASYQEISTAGCTITVKEVSGAKMYINNANSNTGSFAFYPEVGEQIVESESQSTFAKGAGIVIIVDKEA